MADAHAGAVLRQIERLYDGGTVSGLSDAELLARFVADGAGAEAAFEGLVRRHGPMVLRVCRDLLGDRHEAEDAFQATFLVLVRRSRGLWIRGSLGPWLHGVARRTAMKVRAREARRRSREKVAEGTPLERLDSVPAPDLDEVGPSLHQEVGRLPPKYRAAVTLCYFEGRTHEEAARELGCPVGTVRGHLSRGRDLLRSRLVRRGLAPAGWLAAGALELPQARADVPAALREATVGIATRGLPVAAEVRDLSRVVVRGLLLFRLSTVASAIVGVVLVVSGGSLLAIAQAPNDRGPVPVPGAVPVPKPAAPEREGEPLPKRERALMGTLPFHNGDSVGRVLYSPDGRTLVSLGRDVLRVWDVATGAILRDFGDPATRFSEFALSPDGKTLATAQAPGGLRLWDLATGRKLLRQGQRAEDGFNLVAFSPDGKTLAASLQRYHVATQTTETGIVTFHTATLGERRRFGGDWAALKDLRFSPDGKTLASATFDAYPDAKRKTPSSGSTRLWDAATGKELRRFSVEDSHVLSVAFSPDGRWLAASVTDRTIRVYDLLTGQEREPRLGRGLRLALPPREEEGMGRFPNGSGAMTSLAFSPDGSILASGREGAEDGSSPFSLAAIRLWDVAQGREIRTIPAHQQWVHSVSFSPDGKTIASSGAEPVIRVWDVATGREAFPQSGHRSAVRSLAVSRADGTVFTGGYDGTVRHWDPANGRELGVIATMNAPVDALAVSPDGKTLVLGTASVAGNLGLWSVAECREVIRLPRVEPQNPVRYAAFSPDGKTVASELQVWDVATGRVLVQFRHGDVQRDHYANFIPIAYSPDGSRIITTERDGVYLWDIASGKAVGQAVRATLQVHAVALSPDGRLLATGGVVDHSPRNPRDEPIRVWELATGQEVATLRGHGETTRGLAFSPDGRFLASGSGHYFTTNDRTVRLWDLASGREIGRFERHHGPINAVAFSPDGRSLFSASDDATAMSWDVSALWSRAPLQRGKAIHR